MDAQQIEKVMFTLTLLDVTLNCSIKLLSCYAVIFLSILSHSFCCHTLFAVVSFCGLHVFLWQHGVPVIQLENPRVINSTSPHNHKHQHQRQLKYQHQDIHEHQHQYHHDTPGHSNPLRHLSLSPVHRESDAT